MSTQRDESGDAGEARPATAAGPRGEPWLLAACLCVVAAVVCLLLGYYDAAFVTAALGAVAWFLDVRRKLPRPPEDGDADESLPEEEDDDKAAAG